MVKRGPVQQMYWSQLWEVTIMVCNFSVHFSSMIYHCYLTVTIIPTILMFIFDEKTAPKYLYQLACCRKIDPSLYSLMSDICSQISCLPITVRHLDEKKKVLILTSFFFTEAASVKDNPPDQPGKCWRSNSATISDYVPYRLTMNIQWFEQRLT